MLIVEDPTVTLQCRTAIKVLLLYRRIFTIFFGCMSYMLYHSVCKQPNKLPLKTVPHHVDQTFLF